MDELRQRIHKFVSEREWDRQNTPDHLAKSINIEAGELLEHFQWGESFSVQEVGEELADVMIYCIQMAEVLGLDPREIILDKMIKNEERYPIDKIKGIKKKYNEL